MMVFVESYNYSFFYNQNDQKAQLHSGLQLEVLFYSGQGFLNIKGDKGEKELPNLKHYKSCILSGISLLILSFGSQHS